LNEQPACELLPWDTEFFGCTIARVSGITDRAALLQADGWCRERGVAVAYLHLAERATGIVPEAEELGFVVVDERLVFCYESDGDPVCVPAEPREVVVRPYDRSDLAELERIASLAHHDSRFYIDGRFSRERCDALYSTWIRRDCEDPHCTVLVAAFGDDVAGYVAVRSHRRSSRATIDLIAVDERHRGRNVGTLLVGAALGHSVATGARHVEVATQARNVAARRLYERLGMVNDSVTLWLHKWYDR
jgi:dTDP-4-amino-4,6-dideoxy-D-galactose acyltransferase